MVVISHIVLAFLPRYIGLTPSGDPAVDLIGSPLFVLLNGTGMVVVFFVLSGYVLAQKGLRADATAALLDSAVKRYARLTPLILIAVLLSWALFHENLYAFEDAARLSHSVWLQHFSNGQLSQHDHPTLWFAIRQGLGGVLLGGNASLDSSLWTMSLEFIGSFMVFGLALLLRPRWRRALPAVLLILAVWLLVRDAWMFPFVLGIAACLLPLQGRTLPSWAAIGLCLIGLYLAGFEVADGTTMPIGAYAWVGAVTPPGLHDPRNSQIVFMCGMGALLLLIVFATRNFVSRRFSGRIAQAAGAASFPLYVMHVLVLDSASCWSYARLGGGLSGLLGATLVLIVVLAPLVWLLAKFDLWWLAVLRRWRINRPPAPAERCG